ncbi:MAG: hypothetical protein R2729_13095 [Bryobacteraceae bacterium]
MNATCTCGARLVEDALFCHKCGRPQRELPNPSADEGELHLPPPAETPVPAASIPVPPPSIGFGNPAAVRVAVIVAVIGSIASLLSPLPSFLVMLWRLLVMVACGFLAVHLYNRRSGQWLDVRSGIRLGWMTGFFSYLIAMVLSVAAIASLAYQPGGLTEFWRKQMGEHAAGPEAEEALRILESPEGLFTMMAAAFLIAFLVFTALPMIGGALGAKVLEKE